MLLNVQVTMVKNRQWSNSQANRAVNNKQDKNNTQKAKAINQRGNHAQSDTA